MTENSFGRKLGSRINERKQSITSLVGIVTGILADRHLDDAEIGFLTEWLDNNMAVASSWPGNVIAERIRAVLADGIVTEDERADLVKTLQSIVGGTIEELAECKHVTTLALDDIERIEFQGAEFCLTGDFIMGRKSTCAEAIEIRGGNVRDGVSKKISYLIVGGLGSPEWKHGSFGLKVERCMELKRQGASILIVHEDCLARSLQAS